MMIGYNEPAISSELVKKTFDFGIAVKKFLLSLPKDQILIETYKSIDESSLNMSRICERATKRTDISDKIWDVDLILGKIESIIFSFKHLEQTLPEYFQRMDAQNIIKIIDELEIEFDNIKSDLIDEELDQKLPIVFPHIGKISFAVFVISLILYSFVFVKNPFIMLIFFISGLTLFVRLYNLAFTWDKQDLIKRKLIDEKKMEKLKQRSNT